MRKFEITTILPVNLADIELGRPGGIHGAKWFGAPPVSSRALVVRLKKRETLQGSGEELDRQ